MMADFCGGDDRLVGVGFLPLDDTERSLAALELKPSEYLRRHVRFTPFATLRSGFADRADLEDDLVAVMAALFRSNTPGDAADHGASARRV